MSPKAEKPQKDKKAAAKKPAPVHRPIDASGSLMLDAPISGKNVNKFLEKAVLCACAGGDADTLNRILPLLDLGRSKVFAAEAFKAAAATGHAALARKFIPHLDKGKSLDKMLQAATAGGDLDLIREVLADVPKDSAAAKTFLSVATINSRHEALKLFTAHFDKSVLVSDDQHPRSRTSAIINAAAIGDLASVEGMLPFSSPAEIDGALFSAVSHVRPSVVEYLLPHANPEEVKRGSILSTACASGSLENVKLLAPHSEEGFGCNPQRHTALVAAAANGHLEIVDFLLDNPLKPNEWLQGLSDEELKKWSLEKHGAALAAAAQIGKIDIVKRLLPVSDPKHNNSAAIAAAIWHGHTAIVELLLPHSDIHAANNGHHSGNLLYYSARDGRVELLKLLLPHYPKKDKNGDLLAAAAGRGQVKAVELLIPECGPDRSGALLEAANYGREDVVKMLLPFCDPNANDCEALFAAISQGSKKVVDILLPVCNPKKSTNQPVLQMLAFRDDVEMLKLVVQFCDKQVDNSALSLALARHSTAAVKLLIPISDINNMVKDIVDGTNRIPGFSRHEVINRSYYAQILAEQLAELDTPVPGALTQFIEKHVEKGAIMPSRTHRPR